MSKRKNNKGAAPSVRQDDVLTTKPTPQDCDVLQSPSDPDLYLNVHSGSRVVHEISSQCFSYPGPPPEIIEAYNRISPGLGDRLFAMAEREQETHIFERRSAVELEKLAVEGKIALEKRGQNYALLAMFTVCATAVILARSGAPEIAAIIVAISGLVAVFLRRPPVKPKKSKDENNSVTRK